TPIEVLPRERKVEAVRNRLQHANAFGDNFTADAVSLDHRYFVGFQVSSPLSRFTPILFAAKSCQSAHIRNAFELAHELNHAIGLRFGPLRKRGTTLKFLSHFFKAHRIRWTAFSEICPARDDAPVFQRDLEDGGHLVEIGRASCRDRVYT